MAGHTKNAVCIVTRKDVHDPTTLDGFHITHGYGTLCFSDRRWVSPSTPNWCRQPPYRHTLEDSDNGPLLAAWGNCDFSGPCLEDIKLDGEVDGADLGLLLAGWTANENCPCECPGAESLMSVSTVSLEESAETIGFETVADVVEWLGEVTRADLCPAGSVRSHLNSAERIELSSG